MTPQEMLERALAASTADESVVLVSESSSANLRWAGNTLTTNGVMQSRDVTVVSIAHREQWKGCGRDERQRRVGGRRREARGASRLLCPHRGGFPGCRATVDAGVAADFG